MNLPPLLAFNKTGFTVASSVILCLSMIFLQEGFTYYVSFQVLALIVIWALVLSTLRTVKSCAHFVVAYTMFTLFLSVTAVVSPLVIAQNSSNILITVVGICIYALMIGCLPHLRFMRVGLMLSVLRSVSAATILVLAGLLLVSESNVLPFLNRTAMLEQNTRLIDNYSDADAISADQALGLLLGTSERVDLFYGEPSFLAIVLLSCLGCFLITSRLISYACCGATQGRGKARFGSTELVALIGVLNLMYVQSFSSIIYALIVIYFAFIKGRITRGRLVNSLPFVLVLGVAFAVFSYDYLMYRLTQTDSVSFAQRFGFLWEMDLIELLVGLKDASLLPEVGIHNGLFYVVAISGFGGVLYVASMLYSAYTLAARIQFSMFLTLLMLAIMMQNGGIFSPSKVVLFSLVLLPLACVRSIDSHHRRVALLGQTYA